MTVQTEGTREVRRSVEYYNPGMILAIGYRVRSHRGTQFRRWATERLREYLIKGFVPGDDRLKDGRSIGADGDPRRKEITVPRNYFTIHRQPAIISGLF